MKNIIYLDAAASSLKPESVIFAQKDFLENNYANAGRGICARASYVDEMVHSARIKTADFIGAKLHEQIVFTSGATDGFNRIVRILQASNFIDKDSVVLVSDLDHHSARLPWEHQAYIGNCKIKVCDLDSDFNLNLSENTGFFDIFIITAMSNVMGVSQDVSGLIKQAKAINPSVITIVDAAQYVAHKLIDANNWGADFICFSGHKIGTDTGLGIMYVREPNRWSVDNFGGGMVAKVNSDTPNNNATSTWVLANGIDKYEAGTLPLTQIAGLPFAIDNLSGFNKDNKDLIKYLYSELSNIDRIKILTSSDASVLTFVIKDMHSLDFGALMGAYDICVRVGTMCASWIFKAMGQDSAIRISLGFWNTKEEIISVISVIKKILKV